MRRQRKLPFAAIALAFALTPAIAGAGELSDRMPASVIEASDYLDAIRKARGEDGPAITAALEMVDTALADYQGRDETSVTRRSMGKPQPVGPTRKRTLGDRPPGRDAMEDITSRTHVSPPLPTGIAPKARKLTPEDAAAARALVATLKELVKTDPTGAEVKVRLDELSTLLGPQD